MTKDQASLNTNVLIILRLNFNAVFRSRAATQHTGKRKGTFFPLRLALRGNAAADGSLHRLAVEAIDRPGGTIEVVDELVE